LDSLPQFLLLLPVLIFSVVAHEYAHGFAALRQGDPTAQQLGRLTLNPVKHIDPFMTIIMPAILYFTAGFILGGAKPVPVNPRNFRNYRRGDIIVSLAGVAANLAIALVAPVFIAVAGVIGNAIPATQAAMAVVQFMLVFAIIINLILIAFNLLPIPPLDGSHVVKHLLPPRIAVQYDRIGAYGIFILIAFLMFQPLREILMVWMTPAFVGAQFLRSLVGGLMLPMPFLS
jgi:Zn-dependent protease